MPSVVVWGDYQSIVTESLSSSFINFFFVSVRELSFKKGDFLDLLHTVDDNWLEAKVGDSKGIVPRNYVKVRVSSCSQQDYGGFDVVNRYHK